MKMTIGCTPTWLFLGKVENKNVMHAVSVPVEIWSSQMKTKQTIETEKQGQQLIYHLKLF